MYVAKASKRRDLGALYHPHVDFSVNVRILMSSAVSTTRVYCQRFFTQLAYPTKPSPRVITHAHLFARLRGGGAGGRGTRTGLADAAAQASEKCEARRGLRLARSVHQHVQLYRVLESGMHISKTCGLERDASVDASTVGRTAMRDARKK